MSCQKKIWVMMVACFATSLVAWTLSVSADTPPNMCQEVLKDDKEVCPGCPGISVCTCLYIGAACPSQNISCSMFPNTRPWDDKLMDYVQAVCVIRRQCKVQNGGATCHPETNPCVIYGSFVIEMDNKPRQTNDPC